MPEQTPDRLEELLSQMESQNMRYTSPPEPEKTSLTGEIGRSFGRGVIDVAQVVPELADFALNMFGAQDVRELTTKQMLGAMDAWKESETLKPSPEAVTDKYSKEWFAANLPQAGVTLASMFIPMSLAGKVAKGVKGFKALSAIQKEEKIRKYGTAAAVMSGIGMEGGFAHGELRRFAERNPDDPNVTALNDFVATVGTGVFAGGLEALTGMSFFNKMFGANGGEIAGQLWKRIMKEAPEGVAKEGGTEYIQSLIGNFFARAGYDPTRKLTEGAFDSLVIGGLLGGGMGAVTAVGQEPKPPKKTVEDIATVGNVDEAIAVAQEAVTPEEPDVPKEQTVLQAEIERLRKPFTPLEKVYPAEVQPPDEAVYPHLRKTQPEEPLISDKDVAEFEEKVKQERESEKTKVKSLKEWKIQKETALKELQEKNKMRPVADRAYDRIQQKKNAGLDLTKTEKTIAKQYENRQAKIKNEEEALDQKFEARRAEIEAETKAFDVAYREEHELPPRAKELFKEEREAKVFEEKVRRELQEKQKEEKRIVDAKAEQKKRIKGWEVFSEGELPAKPSEIEVPEQSKKTILKEAKTEVDENPIFKVMAEARRQTLNLKELYKDYDKDTVKEISRKLPAIFSYNGKTSPDGFASEQGFESLDDMIEAFKSAPSKKKAVAALVAQKIGEWQDAESMATEKKDFTPVNKEMSVGHLNEGDKIIVDNEEFEHTGYDKDGNAVLEDGVTKKLDPFEMLDVQAIKKGKVEKISRPEGKVSETQPEPDISKPESREESIEERVKQAVPGQNINYDGAHDFGKDKPKLHSFTVKSGKYEGNTFGSESTSAEDIRKAYEEMTDRFDKPTDKAGKQLDLNFNIEIKNIREKTGEIIIIEKNAKTALAEIDEDILTLQKIMDCL